jgi:GntR family transcriptional regulator
MKIAINPQSGTPLYLQLVEGMKDAIAAGLLAPGDEVPSVRAASAELRVNYHTVAKAYRLLEQDGVLARRRGEPYRVAAGAAEASADDLLREEIARLIQRARAMGLSDAELLERVRSALSQSYAEMA